MTATNELLWNHHIENCDFDGALTVPTKSAEELLRDSAEEYLRQAIESGEVIESRIFHSKQLGKFVGYTTVETASGVKIRRGSEGNLSISADYDEEDGGDVSHDLTVETEIFADGSSLVHEKRQRVEAGIATGYGGSRTLTNPSKERIMGEVTKLIWQRFD